MINEKVSNEELEAFIAEPVNGMVMMPNRDLAVAMAEELLALRKAASKAVVIADLSEVDLDDAALEHELMRPDGIIVIPPAYPKTLPCPVLLEPGMRFSKGVATSTFLKALQRRADYYAKLEAMTPEERAEHDANIEDCKAMIPPPPTAPEDPE